MVKSIPVLRQNIIDIKELLIESNVIKDPREADQISVAMASHFALITNVPVTKENGQIIIDMAVEMNLGQSEYESDNDSDEPEKCLDAILDTIIIGRKVNIASVINELRTDKENKFKHEDLESFGIRFFPETNELFISGNNRQLKKDLSDTMYHNYTKVLKRHESFIKYSNCRISGRNTKGTFILLPKNKVTK